MYQQLFQNFFTENRGPIILNTLLFIMMYPIEIMVLSWLSGMIFFQVKEGNLKSFFWYSYAFTGVILLLIGSNYLISRLESSLLPKLQSSVRRSILQTLQQNPNYSSNTKDGEIMSQVMKIPLYMFINYTNISNFVIPFLFAIFFFTIYMYYIHYTIGTITLLFFSVFIALFLHYYRRTIHISTYRFTKDNELMNQFEDLLKNYDMIRSNDRFEYETERFDQQEQLYASLLTDELMEINTIKTLFCITYVLFSLFIIYYCCWMTIHKKIPFFKLIMLVTSIIMLLRIITNLIRRISDSITEFGPIQMESTLLKELPSTDPIVYSNPIERPINSYSIEINHLSFYYPQRPDHIILKDIHLSISFPSTLLITGSMGSGKTTFFKILTREIRIPKGHVSMDGIDINEIESSFFRKHVYIMHQSIRLFKRPVLENLFYGVNPDSYEWSQKYSKLRQLIIFPRIQSFLEFKDATQLSGGQKQVLLLLRGFFRDPKILLLDEPTANVDESMRDLILEMLHLMESSTTIICISHDTSLITHFQNHYQLYEGTLTPSSDTKDPL